MRTLGLWQVSEKFNLGSVSLPATPACTRASRLDDKLSSKPPRSLGDERDLVDRGPALGGELQLRCVRQLSAHCPPEFLPRYPAEAISVLCREQGLVLRTTSACLAKADSVLFYMLSRDRCVFKRLVPSPPR